MSKGMKYLIESGESTEAILMSFTEVENTSNNWRTLENASTVVWKQMKFPNGLQDIINAYDIRRLQSIFKRRIVISQIQLLSLKSNYKSFPARKGLTIVLVPCASNLCMEFTHKGSRHNHCFKNTQSFAVAIGENTEFKLLGRDQWNDFATMVFC
jgi:hypothetical protein